uniref:Periviscerokinin-1 n=1 Tax=Polyphaga aegyptiaca TaxID=7085 RepID=PVK1_POLAY|nr:RecName: Full=Periviscerokinin-1; Short=PolAe-PVK-1 [Polyphaga aegyptiaca]
GTSGLISFPRT